MSVVVLIFMARIAAAQNAWSLPGVIAACGPKNQKLEVEKDGAFSKLELRKGRATIYFILEYPQTPTSSLKVRAGLDGRWVGMLQDRSYFKISTWPGVRHLCVSGEWSRFMARNSIALYALRLKPGSVHYVRIRFLYPSREGVLLGMDEVDKDEGRFLVSTSRNDGSRHSTNKSPRHSP